MRFTGFFSKSAVRLLAGFLALLCLACTPKKNPRHGREIPTAPLAPTFITVTNDDGFATISWSQMKFATHYDINFATAPGAYGAITARNVQPPFTFGGLVNAQNYYVTIESVGELGHSPPSSELTLSPANGAGTDDAFFSRQWHLDNLGTATGDDGVLATAGQDVNVTWPCVPAHTCRGEGVRVAVVDDGLEIAHEDLKANVFPGLSYNYLTTGNDPDTSGGHGTAVAGIIAARDLNTVGVRGVAPRANLVGYNMLADETTSTNENIVDALTRNRASVHVSNNSWGPGDAYLGCPVNDDAGAEAAFATGTTSGRSNLGTVYVIAAGNGDGGGELCTGCQGIANLNRLASSRYTVTVGAVNAHGVKSTYSETGANLLVSAPGGEYCSTAGTTGTLAINTTDVTSGGINKPSSSYTTDLNNRKYTRCMNGTSAATPAVSGAAALVLQANPALGWRDVKWILAATARQNDAADPGWVTNAAGFRHNNRYGHGVVDATAAVAMAAGHVNFGAELFATAAASPAAAIADNGAAVNSTVNIAASGINDIEYVEVTIDAGDHDAPSDLELILRSPAGTDSVLVPAHNSLDPTDAISCVNRNKLYLNFKVGSNAFMGESADGAWRLSVRDRVTDYTGTFNSWRVTVYGH